MMDNIIEINDFSFSYEEKTLLSHLNLKIQRGTWMTLLGNNGSGKSTLVKVLTGLLPSNQRVKVSGLLLNQKNLREVRSLIGVVFENPTDQLIGETVIDHLAFGLENMRYERAVMQDMIEEVVSLLHMENLISRSTDQLSGGEKQLVALASVLVMRPRILILDEALTMIDEVEKNHILKILKKLHKTTGITILNVTHDVEESVYGDEIAILKDGHILLSGEKELVYKNEKVLKEAHLELPFMVSLSKKLGYYHLVDKTIYNMNEMVDALWK